MNKSENNKVVIEMTLEEAAKELRKYAELTAKISENWDNYEKIVFTMFEAIRDGLRDRQDAAVGVDPTAVSGD